MIRSVGNRDTQRFFEGRRIRAFEGFRWHQATRRLAYLGLRDLSELHSNRLESLSGDRAGQYSIRINR